MTKQLALAVLATWCAAASGLRAQHDECADHEDWDQDRGHYCEVREIRVANTKSPLAVDASPNGGVRVTGGDGDSIVVRAIVQATARSDSQARALVGDVRVISTGGPIHAEGPSTHGHISWWVSFRVAVPRHTDLTLQTENGGIQVADVEGRMRLTSENGGIVLRDVAGDVHARAENGPLHVALSGKRWSGAGLDAETVNGPVSLTIPTGYAAHLETGTVNGPTDIDIPLTLEGHIDLRHLSIDIGGGGPPIRVVTTNGPLGVHHD